MREVRNKIILICLSLLVSFIFIEVGYQTYLFIKRPVTVYFPDAKALNPRGEGKYRGGFTSLDEFGLRNKIDNLALKRKHKILVVGDSVTFGMGVNDDEVFVHHLNVLNEKTNIGFVNLGEPGFGTELLRIHFLKHHLNFTPYIGIVWVYNINDARLNKEYLGLNREIINYDYYSAGSNNLENFIWPYLKSPTLLKNLVKNFINMSFRKNNKTNIEWQDYYKMCLQSYDPNSKKAEIEKKYIQEIIKWSKELEVPLGFVLVPVTNQFEDGRIEPQEFIKSISSENNIPVLDLMPLFRELQRPVKEFYLPGDHGHLNAKGNKYVAQWINHFLQVNTE